MKAVAFYSLGRGVDIHFPGPPLVQIAVGSVELNAAGVGFAAAGRIEIYMPTVRHVCHVI